MSAERAGVRAAPLVDRAREATSRRAWAEAYDLLVEGDRAGVLSCDDRAMLAEVAYAAGRLDVTIESWERVHGERLANGDALGAAGAAVKVAMHLLIDTAMMAPVRGWLARADRLLANTDPSAPGVNAVHAWVAVARNYERMFSGDAEGARMSARRAIELGGAHEPTAAAIGRIAEARCLILLGDVEKGLVLLDETGVVATSGELDPLSTGIVYCELVCALQGLGQIDLAEEWTHAMERWSAAKAIGSIHGRCRVHRAEIFRFRGSLDRAEDELSIACDELRPYVRRELGWPLTELGRVRLRKRDLDGAEQALLAAHDAGWDAQPGLALVQLARGDHAGAAYAIRDALARPGFAPSKELPPDNDLWRFPLLEAQVEIGVAAGGDDLARARAACDELARIASRFASKPFDASAALARGRLLLADGEAYEAERHLEAAARTWHDAGAPYEAAHARMALARALRASGRAAAADLELRAAHAILERLGIAPERAPEVPATQLSERPGTPCNAWHREGDTWSITFEGTTIRIGSRRGFRYIARLLAEPRRQHHVLDLVADFRTGSAIDVGDAGPHLDESARRAYQRRLADIDDDLAEAERHADAGRIERAQHERELLVRELARAFGTGGQHRPGAGSAVERARVSATRAIRQAIALITERHRALGEHLTSTIKTGTFCSYALDPGSAIVWTVSDE